MSEAISKTELQERMASKPTKDLKVIVKDAQGVFGERRRAYAQAELEARERVKRTNIQPGDKLIDLKTPDIHVVTNRTNGQHRIYRSLLSGVETIIPDSLVQQSIAAGVSILWKPGT